jgi:hypothetical protein
LTSSIRSLARRRLMPEADVTRYTEFGREAHRLLKGMSQSEAGRRMVELGFTNKYGKDALNNAALGKTAPSPELVHYFCRVVGAAPEEEINLARLAYLSVVEALEQEQEGDAGRDPNNPNGNA